MSHPRPDVDFQRLLVLLDGEDVVPAGLDHCGGEIALAEPRIDYDHPDRYGQESDQTRSRLVFVGFRVDSDLSEDCLVLVRIRSERVNAGDFAVPGAAQGLAADADPVEGLG